MRRLAPLMLTIAVTAGACGGADDEATPTTPPATSATTEPAPTDAPTTTETTTTTTTVAPTTTIDEAAILAEAEAAYLEAFAVARMVFRNPDDPANEESLKASYTGDNLERSLQALDDSRSGQFVAVENADNPSFATIVAPAAFISEGLSTAALSVCEFNSDRIFEEGAAPDGSDALVRDDPVSLLFVVTMKLEDGDWKSSTGTRSDEVRDEVERCSEF